MLEEEEQETFLLTHPKNKVWQWRVMVQVRREQPHKLLLCSDEQEAVEAEEEEEEQQQ